MGSGRRGRTDTKDDAWRQNGWNEEAENDYWHDFEAERNGRSDKPSSWSDSEENRSYKEKKTKGRWANDEASQISNNTNSSRHGKRTHTEPNTSRDRRGYDHTNEDSDTPKERKPKRSSRSRDDDQRPEKYERKPKEADSDVETDTRRRKDPQDKPQERGWYDKETKSSKHEMDEKKPKEDKPKKSKGAWDATNLEKTLLQQEVAALRQRKKQLQELLACIPTNEAQTTVHIPTKREPVLLIQTIQSAYQDAHPQTKQEKQQKHRIILLDRENNCTQFMDGVIRLPEWLDVYCTWNPLSKNKLNFIPQLQKRVVSVSGEHSILRAMNALAGMLAREHIKRASSTYIYLVYNAGNSPRRYLEIYSVLKELGYKVELLNGAGPNFSDFMNHVKKDPTGYCRQPATGLRIDYSLP